jgi:hypothetical protein
VRKLAGEGAVTLCSALDIFKAWGIEPGEENTAFFSPEVRETGAGGETARFLAEDLARSLQIEL